MAVPFIRSSCFLASRGAKRSSLGILLALVMLGAWTLWFLRARVSVFAVTDLANLEVDRSAYPVQAPVEGRVISTNLSLEGQVKAGDVLVTLESNQERLQLSEERTKLSMLGPQIDAIEKTIVDAGAALQQDQLTAKLRMEEALGRLRQAEAAVQSAELDAKHYEGLYAEGLGAEIDAKRARAAVVQRRAAMDTARVEFERVEQQERTQWMDRQTQSQQLETQVAQLAGQQAASRSEIVRLEDDVHRRDILAPVDGSLGEVANIRPGSVVHQGDLLAAVVPAGKLRIVARFLPADALGRIRPGASARLRLHGFPWSRFGSVPAVVSSVASEVRDGRIRVEFSLTSEQPSVRVPLQHGLPGTVEVEVARTTPAALIVRLGADAVRR